LTIFALFAAYYMSKNPILSMLQWVPGFVALIVWGAVGLNYSFSEFAVTNKRVMMREGFFTRHSNEMRLTAISQVNVDQSLFGQMLGYGTVSINAFGAFDYYPTIANPTGFQRAVNQQLDKAIRA
jgi:uncharacterized membrane protein YdbT with pleckstrin-like domain